MYRIVPEEGEAVKEIFCRYLAGDSAYRITADLASRGIRGKDGAADLQAVNRRFLVHRIAKYLTEHSVPTPGDWYGPKVWHSKDKYKRTVYRCNEKYRTKGQKTCDGPTLTEEQIHQMFITAVNQLAEVKAEAAANIRMLTETVCDTDALISERESLCGELDALSGSIERMVKENARTAIDQEAYREKEDRLCGIYTEKYERLQFTDDIGFERF